MESDYRVLWNLSGGKSPTHWVFHSIESLLKDSKSISVGVMYPGGSNETGIPLIRVADVKDGRVVNKPDYLISDKVDEEYKRTRLDGSELLITLVGNPGDCVVVSDYMKGWNVARALAVVRLDDPSIREWLRYVLLSPPAMHQIDSRLNTTVQRTLNLKDIRAIGVPLPPKKERDAITNALNTLDDKIELNRQMNATLEAMAQALFKSWFVDFDPVIDNALAAGNAIPDEFVERAEQRKGIEKKDNSDIQKLFPNAFNFTEEMGWIPKGWVIKSAEEVASVAIGKTPPRKEPQWFSDTKENNLVWVSIRDMGNSNVFIDDSSEYLTKESVAKFNVRTVPKDAVILSFKFTVGRVLITQTELTTNEAIAHFSTPRFGMSKEYVYCYLNNFNYDSLGSTSSIATAVNSKIIKAMPFIVPSELILNGFENTSKMYFDKISIINQQTQALAKLRDTLLPKLMSGELRIPDAAAMVEEA